MALTVQIVGPDRTLWSGDADAVSVPASEGVLGILPGRQPVLAVLRPGKVTITRSGGTESVDIEGGFVSFDDDDVMIVVDEHDERRADHAEAAVER
ncbi:F0F1 ATP synthase subunit epsilon [Georgenia phoenicis]|uniref:F0F1 ATP synthase subunit epsilon n=1 Tax=unclassified Georgenia TaxID=2626815 RepID=UPI0039AF5A6A